MVPDGSELPDMGGGTPLSLRFLVDCICRGLVDYETSPLARLRTAPGSCSTACGHCHEEAGPGAMPPMYVCLSVDYMRVMVGYTSIGK